MTSTNRPPDLTALLREARNSRGRGRGRGSNTVPDESLASTPAPLASSKDKIVQQTDQDASVSRISAVSLGYLHDPFAALFLSDTQARRFPIINRGKILILDSTPSKQVRHAADTLQRHIRPHKRYRPSRPCLSSRLLFVLETDCLVGRRVRHTLFPPSKHLPLSRPLVPRNRLPQHNIPEDLLDPAIYSSAIPPLLTIHNAYIPALSKLQHPRPRPANSQRLNTAPKPRSPDTNPPHLRMLSDLPPAQQRR